MSFIKKNKSTVIAIVVFVVVLILLIQIKNIFFSSEEEAIYGTRLEGIEKVKISNDKEAQVKSSLEETVSNATVRQAGRIVNIILTVNSDVSVDTAKTYANKAIESFTNDQKKYYDFQVFIKKENDSTEFPIIGYKQHSKENFSWTKDRTGNE